MPGYDIVLSMVNRHQTRFPHKSMIKKTHIDHLHRLSVRRYGTNRLFSHVTSLTIDDYRLPVAQRSCNIQDEISHYSDVIIRALASQITVILMVCSTICSGADQRKHQSSALLAFVRGVHRWPVNPLHKGPVTRKCFHLMTSSWQILVCRFELCCLITENTFHLFYS